MERKSLWNDVISFMDIIRQFKALSDPTRLRLLYILYDVELNVNEIVSIVEMVQSGVSRHLKIMLDSGLLKSRKQGSFIYYSADKRTEVRPLLDLACSCIKNNPVCCADLVKARQCISIRNSNTKRFFKSVAHQWEGLKKEVLGNFDLNAELIQRIQGRIRIADLGCGTGELLGLLSRDPHRTLIGVDASPDMLDQARIKFGSSSAIELRLGEVEYLPMKDQEVEAVIMSMVLYHIFQPEKAIQEVFRVLQPGGEFILADFDRHERESVRDLIGGSWLGFEQEQIVTWLDECGFEGLILKRFPVAKGLYIHLFTARK